MATPGASTGMAGEPHLDGETGPVTVEEISRLYACCSEWKTRELFARYVLRPLPHPSGMHEADRSHRRRHHLTSFSNVPTSPPLVAILSR